MAEVTAFFYSPGVPGALNGINVVVPGVCFGLEADVVEHIKFCFWSEESGVGDSGGTQESLSLGRYLARVAGIGLVSERVDDVVVHIQGLVLPEWVHVGRGQVGNQLHVRLVDCLEAADG